MRHLPQEQDGEQHQRGRVDASRGRGPSDERRDGSGNGAHEERCRRTPLQWRVYEGVNHEREGREQAGEGADDEREKRNRNRGEQDAEEQGAGGIDAAGGQRSVHRARHQRIGVALEVHVEDVRRGDDQNRSEHREQGGAE